MDRESPRTTSNEIDLYIRTYYSLLRTSADVRVRTFEESHLFSDSSLHADARESHLDLGAFAYAAARLPSCMPSVKRLILGQNNRQFERGGFDVSSWERVWARGRRRLLMWDRADTLAVYITSASDIDDLIPIVTAYQIEWNKINLLLAGVADFEHSSIQSALGLDEPEMLRLIDALQQNWQQDIEHIAETECDVTVRLLDGSLREYRRTARTWFSAIEEQLDGGPVYFVSSNSHSLPNLLGGYTRGNASKIDEFIRRNDPEGLGEQLDKARERGDEATVSDISYYSLRRYLAEDRKRLDDIAEHDRIAGITSVQSTGGVDVDAQVIRMRDLIPELLDQRCQIPGLEKLAASNATIINIDYPLGLGAYHHLAEISLGAHDLRGIYIMGKAATLNGRVGDVMISEVVYDEHSKNTYVFENQFAASDITPHLRRGTVLDHQKAVTVRSAFLQNHDYMGVFYQEGYTVLEMEAGPYLSALYEMVAPKRHPNDQIVRLSSLLDLELGIIHYASDTPYSRRQHLLSKSMSYFGVDATYASALAIVRRILEREVEDN